LATVPEELVVEGLGALLLEDLLVDDWEDILK